ncbi:MAG: hypothetical protein ACE5DX_01380 [Candidatus Dojkabacteria bacterium]
MPKGAGNQVAICREATSLAAVSTDCSGYYTLDEADSNVTVADEGGITYWVDFVLSQATTDGTTDFDFNSIDVGDIDLEDDDTDLTLCTGANPCSAAVGTWGVNINATTDIIIFTAPTDAGAGEIASGSIVNVLIGFNADDPSAGDTRIVNPTTVGLYEISIRLDTGTDYYCDVPTMQTSIFTTNLAPIDSLRLEWEVGASPDAGDSTGTYTDRLTFLATATYYSLIMPN